MASGRSPLGADWIKHTRRSSVPITVRIARGGVTLDPIAVDLDGHTWGTADILKSVDRREGHCVAREGDGRTAVGETRRASEGDVDLR